MKATKAEIAQRVEAVLGIRLNGAEFGGIVQYASEKGWCVGERQLWNYVAASDRLLAQRLEKDRDKLFARHVALRWTLYARAVNGADYKTALAVAKDAAALQGLYPPQKVAPTTPDGTKPFEGKVTHDIASDLLPYADALRVVISHSGTVPPDGPEKPVDTP